MSTPPPNVPEAASMSELFEVDESVPVDEVPPARSDTLAHTSHHRPAPSRARRSTERGWFTRREHDGALMNGIRLGLVIAGLALIVVGVLAIFRPATPELGGTALAVIGAALIALAVIGRTPSKVSGGGLTLEFPAVAQILELAGEGDADVFDQIVQVIRTDMGAQPEVRTLVDDVVRAVEDAEDFRQDTLSSDTPGVLPSDPNDLGPLRSRRGFRENVTVRVPDGSRAPRVDGAFPFSGRGVAVEIVHDWNPVVEGLVRQRMRRVLTNPDFAAGMVIVPRADLQEASAAIRDERVLVLTPRDLPSLDARLQEIIPAA